MIPGIFHIRRTDMLYYGNMVVLPGPVGKEKL